jgi:hypothetical protein
LRLLSFLFLLFSSFIHERAACPNLLLTFFFFFFFFFFFLFFPALPNSRPTISAMIPQQVSNIDEPPREIRRASARLESNAAV